MPEMIRGLVVIALLSCGSRSHPAPAQPAPPAPPADAASPPLADAPTPTSTAADGRLYAYGKPLPAGHDDRYTCRASDDQIRTCTGACRLMPPVKYWDGPLRCSGVALPPPNLADEKQRLAALAIPTCQCSCDPGYKAASDAYHNEILRCSSVP